MLALFGGKHIMEPRNDYAISKFEAPLNLWQYNFNYAWDIVPIQVALLHISVELCRFHWKRALVTSYLP